MNAYRQGVKLTISVAPKVARMLDELLATGLFGLTRAGVAQRLLYRSLQDPQVAAFSPTAVRQSRPLRPRRRRRG